MNVSEINNRLVLANATELCSEVIRQIAGNDISASVNGQLLTADDLKETIAAKLQNVISKRLGGL